MYDDWDLDYTYTPNYESYDLDEIYESYIQSFSQDDELDCDDEYERDTLDYDALAYRHYAWYNKHTTHAPAMSAHTITQKRLVTVTLDIMCYDDLPLEDLNWTDLLDLQGDESVEVNVRDYNNDMPVW